MEESKKKRGLSLSMQMLLGMILGIICGAIFGDKMSYIRFIGDIFMRLLRMCIYPLILFSIIKSIAGVADIRKLRKVGIMFLVYVFVSSGFAALFSVISVKAIRPGANLNWDASAATIAAGESVSSTLINSLTGWIPENPFTALADGNLVQIVFFGIIFGIILASVRDKNYNAIKVLNVIDGINEVMLNMISTILKLAPIGIFAMMSVMVGTTGFEVLKSVGGFYVAYWVSIIAYSIIFIPLVVKFGAKLSPVRYYKNIAPIIVFAVSSLSSLASIPITMKCTKENCGVSEEIVDLITPPAATINQNGAAAEFAGYIVFASLVYNIELSAFQLIFSIVLCIILSMGAAGIPGGGIVMSTIALSVMGLPQDLVPVLAGAYTILDFGATVVNVTGDTTGMVYIASKTGDLDRDVFYSKNVA